MAVPMWTIILKNNGVTDVLVADLGFTISATSSITLSDIFSYVEIASSDNLRQLVGDATLVINNGTSDFSAQSGVDFLTIVQYQELIDKYYSKTQLQTSGQASVHWDNITNKPAAGTPTWLDPVKYIVEDTGLSVAPGSPFIGMVYVDNLNHYQRYNGTAWVDLGLASTNDRIINKEDATDTIYSFNGTTWTDTNLPTINGSFVIVLSSYNVNTSSYQEAQYVWDSTSGTWKFYAFINFSGHLDGGANKHDASEIDVEGTYSNIAGTPTDLETALAGINAALGDGKDTLDTAYDRGGAGLGRTINTDAGAVVLNATGGTNAPLQLTSLSTPPSTGLGVGQFSVVNGFPYIYDNTRSKWLSINRYYLYFGKDGGTRNVYLRLAGGSIVSNLSGYRLPANATIVAITGQISSSGTADFQIRKNNGTTAVATLSLTSQVGLVNSALNIDVDLNDFIQCYCNNATSVSNPFVIVEIAYRT